MNSLFVITIVVNSIMIQPQYEALQPACQIVVNDNAPMYVAGNCKEIGEDYYRGMLGANPGKPINLIIDGFDYNRS